MLRIQYEIYFAHILRYNLIVIEVSIFTIHMA